MALRRITIPDTSLAEVSSFQKTSLRQTANSLVHRQQGSRFAVGSMSQRQTDCLELDKPETAAHRKQE
jgi:hypothetical protein